MDRSGRAGDQRDSGPANGVALKRLIVAACALRLLVALSPAASVLQHRVETSGPVDSAVRVREALFWVQAGQSPYAGSAYHAPPLLFPLWAPFVAPGAPAWAYVVPGCAADALAAALLHRLARLMHARQNSADTAGKLQICA